jgi:hypothetical protein
VRKRRRCPHERLTIVRTVDALVRVMDGNSDPSLRARYARDALVEHLKAITWRSRR